MKNPGPSPLRLASLVTVAVGSLLGLGCEVQEDDPVELDDVELRASIDPASVTIANYNPATGKVGAINTAVLRKKRPDGTPIDSFGVQVTNESFFLERHYMTLSSIDRRVSA